MGRFNLKGMTNKITLLVEGMHCASCVGRVEAALAGVNGVGRVAVNLMTAQADVELLAAVEPMALVRAIDRAAELARHQADPVHRARAGAG